MIARYLAVYTVSILVALGSASPPAASQELWQGYFAGMTPAQVQARDQQVTPTVKVNRLGNGATCSLSLHNVVISYYDFGVCFFFLGGHLTQVTLQAKMPTEPLFERLVTLLTARYGSPVSRRRTVIGQEADWLIPGGANVGVFFADRFGPPIININYQTRIRDDANKL